MQEFFRYYFAPMQEKQKSAEKSFVGFKKGIQLSNPNIKKIV